ncbi:hypothetical protein N0V94_003122 [Neodidymelliopsis sp. IMI 364377]|nr:hypothetical protein N0V94_003122 [Neodidymelliopsis sp. IMI 364377]
MTTTAQAVPALEVSFADDDMDVLSDTALDLGDGDIDLDLDTAPSVQDDDMSLNDTATDGGFDLQELPPDQDDFMADHGDLIEEDDVYDDGKVSFAATQLADDGVVDVEADMLAPPDEDLIDYSDDEAQQPVKMQSPSVHEDDADVQVTFDIDEDVSVPVDHHEDVQPQGEAQPLVATEVIDAEVQIHQDGVAETDVPHEATSPVHQAQSPVELQEDDDEDKHVHADDDDGGVLLPADEQSHNDHDNTVESQEDVQQAAADAEENHHSVEQQIELRPVTVNYAGNDLWLFKQHDLDDSGDYLLEDMSVAKSSMSGLFQACRASLGDDVSDDFEIGLRFDHLHNLELYEDNTACVAVSLERLVGLYYTLQAQDGNDDPECFYITLQFRPRFATLLADVAHYADQGSGYSTLEVAVGTGDTHFSNVFSSAPTEHENVDWEEEEEEHEIEEADSPRSVFSTLPQELEVGETDDHKSEGAETQEAEQEEPEQEEYSTQDRDQQQQDVILEEESHQTQGTQNEETHNYQEVANIDTSENKASHKSAEHLEDAQESLSEHAPERQTSESRDERTPDQIAHDKQEADDFVDYSDDEDEQQDEAVLMQKSSPSSSTVQGDEPKEVQESSTVLEADGQRDANDTTVDFETEHEDDVTLLTQAQHGDDANNYSFQEYAETHDQGDPFQDFQADGTVGDPFEAKEAFEGDANQDPTDYNFQNLGGEANLEFDVQPSYEDDNQFAEMPPVAEDPLDDDGFLDLDNAPEWAIDAEPNSNLPEDTVLLHDDTTTYENEEGGADDQPVATSSGADPLVPSNEHTASSPQGQKRSIDEVGDGIDDPPDSTDAKRPRV